VKTRDRERKREGDTCVCVCEVVHTCSSETFALLKAVLIATRARCSNFRALCLRFYREALLLNPGIITTFCGSKIEM